MSSREIQRCAGGGLLGVLCLTMAGAVASADDATAYLSWDAAERVMTREALGDGSALIYLTVEASMPLDSLGFHLRWVARDPGTRLALTGIRPTDGAGWVFAPGQESASEGAIAPIGDWLSDPGLLKRVTEPTVEGKWRVQVVLEIEVASVLAARWEASHLTVKTVSGEVLNLGDPAVHVGGGWLLRMQPMITSVEGILNQRFIKSRLYVRGFDLDRLVRFVLLDERGRRVHPARVAIHTPESLELDFVTKSVAEGLCDIEIGNPEGGLDTLRAAVEARGLEHRQPGDTNMGSVPGREE